MNEQEEKKQQQMSELSRDKERAAAAGIGAIVGGAAFAAATYSAGVWDEASHPEIVSIEAPSQATAMTDFDTDAEEAPILTTESDEVSIISVDNSEMFAEGFEYPSEGGTLQAEMEEVVDLSVESATEMPTMDNIDCMCPDSEVMTDDSHLQLI